MGTAVEASLRYISCGDTWVNPVAPRENISATVSRELAEHHLLTPARGKSCPTSLWNIIQRGFPAGWGQFCSPWRRMSWVSVVQTLLVTKLFYSLDNRVCELLRAEGITQPVVPGMGMVFEAPLLMLLSVW